MENEEAGNATEQVAQTNETMREIPWEEGTVTATDGKEPVEKDDDAERDNWRNQEYRNNCGIMKRRHAEILEMIKNGLTQRVIHTKLGVSRTTLWRYIRKNIDLSEAWGDAQEDLLDLNEEVINELATLDCTMVEGENGNFPRFDGRSLATKFNAAKLRLERLGSKRGWNPKIETNEVGNGGRQPIICVGEFSQEELAANKAMLEAANLAALEGLEGVTHG